MDGTAHAIKTTLGNNGNNGIARIEEDAAGNVHIMVAGVSADKIYFDLTDSYEADAPATGEWKIRPVEGNPGWFIIVRERDGETVIYSHENAENSTNWLWPEELAGRILAQLNEEAEK